MHQPSERRRRGRQRAARADLVYVNEFDSGWSRRRCGRGFVYLSTRGKPLTSPRTRKRIKALAIPPAWKAVWICPRSNGHIQAKGTDEGGRSQYIYHERWVAVSAEVKFDRMELMAAALPRIRRRVRRDLRKQETDKRRVLAAVVRLIDKVGIRVGNAEYTDTHGSRGVTTLAPEHVSIDGVEISLAFPGKSGKQRNLSLKDPKVARVIDHCEEINGQFLFSFKDCGGSSEPIDSADVNAYLKDASGEAITAKDFRTWAGSVCALASLVKPALPAGEAARKKRVRDAIAHTAEVLGNTKAVCRSSYIHPGIIAAAEAGKLSALLSRACDDTQDWRIDELTLDESRFAALLPRL